MKLELLSALAWLAGSSLVAAHTLITYPGQRGYNLDLNRTNLQGGQWIYPCGGVGVTQNRTKWPVTGGSIGIEPGWFTGHPTAYMFVNIGFGNDPPNMTTPIVPMFQINGPSREAYPGLGFCLHRIPNPVNHTAEIAVGLNATIQVVEAALHGASLFNCIDITFSEPEDAPEVTPENCKSSPEITFNDIFTTPKELNAASSVRTTVLAATIPLLALFCIGQLL